MNALNIAMEKVLQKLIGTLESNSLPQDPNERMVQFLKCYMPSQKRCLVSESQQISRQVIKTIRRETFSKSQLRFLMLNRLALKELFSRSQTNFPKTSP